MAGQVQFVNGESASTHRGKQNANALDTLSQSETTDQDLASNVNFATGKGPSYNSKSYLPVFGNYTATITTETSGTITVSPASQTLQYHKTGYGVMITGGISISAISSPVGTYVEVNIPFSVYDGTGFGGRSGGSCTYFDGSGMSNLPTLAFESATAIRVYIDASTLSVGDFLNFGTLYFTGA